MGINKFDFANLPTPIQKLEQLSKQLGKEIYIKRDDYTGIEVSGNKVRKLEYELFHAKKNSCDAIITTGAIQSNHCRATAAVCAKTQIPCYIVLGTKKQNNNSIEGNLFFNYMLGAEVILVPSEEREEAFLNLKNELISRGKKPYMIPVGASDAIGSLGYFEAYNEILKQEKIMNINFDTISVAVGSGGTYAGLFKGNSENQNAKSILGFSVSKPKAEFIEIVSMLLQDMGLNNFDKNDIEINDSYIGLGYAKVQKKEIKFYQQIAKQEGLILDPCYTGKTFYGLISEIKNNRIDSDKILYIHTGGIFGWTTDQCNLIGYV